MIYVKGIDRHIPTCWAEVTFETYLPAVKHQNYPVKLLSIFTGIEEQTLRTAKIKNLSQVLQVLNFVSAQPMQTVVPEKIQGYAIPKDLNFESIARYSDIQTVITSMKKDDIDELIKYAEICAIYAYQGKEYDYNEAAKLIPVFLKAPCEEVMAVGNFTLLKLLSLKLNTESPFQKSPTLIRKFRQALIGWLSNLAFTIHYALWKRKLRTKGMSF